MYLKSHLDYDPG